MVNIESEFIFGNVEWDWSQGEAVGVKGMTIWDEEETTGVQKERHKCRRDCWSGVEGETIAVHGETINDRGGLLGVIDHRSGGTVENS